MATQHVIWKGTQRDSVDLVEAVARRCGCEFGPTGVRAVTCGPHRMLIQDQRALDGLLFARYLADRLRQEEGQAA